MSSLVFSPKEYLEKYPVDTKRQCRILAFEFYMNTGAWYQDSQASNYFSRSVLGNHFSNFLSDPSAYILNAQNMDPVELAEALANYAVSKASNAHYIEFLILFHSNKLFFHDAYKGMVPAIQLIQFKHIAQHLVASGNSTLGSIAT